MSGDGEVRLTALAGDEAALIEHPVHSRAALNKRTLRLFTEGVAGGLPLDAAAVKAGTTVDEIVRGGRRVRERLEALRAEYTADAGNLRELVLLEWTETALSDPVTSEDKRLRMAALRELSLVPEVGLKGLPKAGPGERVLSAETLALLDSE